jgi:hypothetical protein
MYWTGMEAQWREKTKIQKIIAQIMMISMIAVIIWKRKRIASNVSGNISGNGKSGNGNSGNGNGENKEQYLYILKHNKKSKILSSMTATANATSESFEKEETILVIPTTEEFNYQIQNPK